jgi:hypothetical protein
MYCRNITAVTVAIQLVTCNNRCASSLPSKSPSTEVQNLRFSVFQTEAGEVAKYVVSS